MTEKKKTVKERAKILYRKVLQQSLCYDYVIII
jgi:hypothetical protein